MEFMASLPVERGRWGETATDFQRRDAAAVLDLMGPPFTFITRPRGGRKSTDAAALCVALHMTTAPPGATSFVVAADAEQAGIVLDSVRSFLRGAQALRKFIKVEARRVVFLTDGEPTSSVAVLPADEASSYGLRPYLVIADELSVWPDSANAKGLWSAVVSAMPKIEGSKLVVVTSARCARPLVGHRARARPHLCAVAGSRNARPAAMDQSRGAGRAAEPLDGLGLRPAP